LSYYSGLAPGSGLTMPADVVLYPIQPGWVDEQQFVEERQLVWGDDKAALKRGWLNSRTPTQYLTVRARKSPHRLEVLDAGDKVRIKNQLNTKIKYLLVLNGQGKCYYGEDIADASSAALQPIEKADAVRQINRLISDNLPQAPAALAASDTELATLFGRTRYGRFGRYSPAANSGRLSENLAGEALANLAGFGDRPGLDLAPRSYVAITETGPEVEVGISYAQQEASFHLIEGKW
jgi:hypothetical protein